MVKVKKSKINKMEKLRRILDNPNDQNIKKLISKEDINLETVRRKLSGKASESLEKQSDDLEKIVEVHEKKEEKSKIKQVEDTRKDIGRREQSNRKQLAA